MRFLFARFRAPVAALAVFVLLVGLFPGSQASAATIVLNGASSFWRPVLSGALFDPGNDTQATASIDLVGDATHPLMYMAFDDQGDGDSANDVLALRFRVDTATRNGNLDGYLWIGIDVDQDGDLDVFLVLEGKNGTNSLYVFQAGSGANASPSTTSVIQGTLFRTLSGSDFAQVSVGAVDGAANGNVDGDANADDFVSFKFNFRSFATVANRLPLTGGGGATVQSLYGSAGLTRDTPIRFVAASAQQTNALNGDTGGYNGTADYGVPYAKQGSFSPLFPLGDPSQASSLDQSSFSLAVPATLTYGSTGQASTSGGSGTGAVTYSAGASTGCTVNAVTGLITVTNASGTCTITATRAGDGTYNPATASQTVTLNKATATVVVSGYAIPYDGISHTAAGTATGVGGEDLSGLLDLSSTTHLTVGTYDDLWSFAGNQNYNGTGGTVTDVISAAAQSSFNLTVPGSLTYGDTGTANAVGGSGTGAVTYSAGASTGCTVEAATGEIMVLDATGTCAITATRAGDGNYLAVTAGPLGIPLHKATATIVVMGYNVVYDGNPTTATGSATGVHGEDLSSLLDLSATVHTNAGAYSDPWRFAGNQNYESADGTVSNSIEPVDQSGISLMVPATLTYGDRGTASGVGGSGTGAVTYSAGASTGCTVEAETGEIAVTDATGTCTITVTRAGDGNYRTATAGPETVTLFKAVAAIDVTGYSVAYDGNAHTAAGTATGANGEDLTSLLDLSGSTHGDVGTYSDAWHFAGNQNYESAGGMVSSSIIPAEQSGFSLSVPGGITYGATGRAAAAGGQGTGAVTYSAGTSTGCTVDEATGVITVTEAGGTCAITATRAGDANYREATTGPEAVTLHKAAATIDVAGYSVDFDGNPHMAIGVATGANGEDLSGLLDLRATVHTDAGSYSDAWHFAGNQNYESAGGTVSDRIEPVAQSGFTLTVPPSITYGDTGLADTDGGSGGGAVTYSAAGSTGCTVNAATGLIRVTDASGTCAITATRAGDGNYRTAIAGPETVALQQANAVIYVTGYNVTYDANAHTATGTAAGVNGEDLSDLLDLSATVHTMAGTYTDLWTFAGNQNYAAAGGAVTSSIAAADQSGFSLTAPGSITYGVTGTAQATGGSGNGAITYDAGSSTGCTIDTDTGAITVTDASGTCDITASKAAEGSYAAVTLGPVTVTLAKATAVVDVTGYDLTFDGNAHTADGTAIGARGEDLRSLLDLSPTTHVDAGAYNDAWSFVGNNNYNSADGMVTDRIRPAAQSDFALTVPVSLTYGETSTATASAGQGVGAVSFSAGDSTGCTVDEAAGVITVTNASGTCWITANKAGDGNYLEGTATLGIPLHKAAATIAVAGYSVAYDGNPKRATGSATGVGGEDLSGLLGLSATVHTNAGTYADPWRFAGNQNYESTSGIVSSSITPVDQSNLSLTVPATLTYGDTGQVDAVGGLGTGAVTYSAGASTGCIVNAMTGVITVTDATGNCAITVRKEGDGNYHAATAGPEPVTLYKATATVDVGGYTVAYDRERHTAVGTALGVKGEDLSSLLDLNGTAHTDVGTYTDAWVFAGNQNYNDANGTVSNAIVAADQSGFSLTVPGSITYGDTEAASAGGGQGTGVVSYSAGTSTGCTVDAATGLIAVTNASGTCAITATRAGDANYREATAGPESVTLHKAAATIDVTGYSVAYDGNPNTATGTATGVGGEDLSSLIDLSATVHTDAGSYSDAWQFAGNVNYNSAGGMVTDRITAVDQSGFFLAVPPSITYGDTGAAAADGGLGAGAVTYSAGASTGCTVDESTGAITVTNASGTCAITATKAGDSNYRTATAGPETVVLHQAVASIHVTGYKVTYDGQIHRAQGTAIGVRGEVLSDLLDLSATVHTRAGTYTDTWRFAGNENYSSADGTGNDQILARMITVMADAQSKTAGTPDPEFTYSVTDGNLASGDHFTGRLTREPGEADTQYAITQGTLALSGDYVLLFLGASLTIYPVPEPAVLPPTIEAMGSIFSAEGDTTSIPVVASGNNGVPITFYASGLPPGVAIDPVTGVIAGKLPYTAGGTYRVTVTVVDSFGCHVSTSFSWTVMERVGVGSLGGTVTDMQTGRSLAGVSVALIGTNDDTLLSATTSASGVYHMPGVPAGAYTVVFRLPEYLTWRTGATVPPEGSAKVDAALQSIIPIRITLPAANAVVDRPPVVTGVFEPDATVTVIVNGQPVGTAGTGPDGTWSFGLLSHAGRLLPGPNTVAAEGTDRNGIKRVSPDVAFTYRGSGSLAGRVLYEDGSAAVGMAVLLLDAVGMQSRQTTTDGQGNYRFDLLPAGLFTVVAPSLENELGRGRATVLTGETVVLNLLLPTPEKPLLPKPERPEQGDHWRYILGYPDQTFKPDRSISRAEVATIMGRILQLPVGTPAAAPFPDVATDQWYSSYVAAAVPVGIMTGYPDGLFRPDAPITRAEAATVAVRLRGLKPRGGSAFTDTAGHWAEGYLQAARTEGVMTGYYDGTFRPQQPITRAEFVTMVNRLLNRGPLLGRPAPRWPDVPGRYWAYGDVNEASTNHTFRAAPGPAEQWLGEHE